jgi:hypothetical protein
MLHTKEVNWKCSSVMYPAHATLTVSCDVDNKYTAFGLCRIFAQKEALAPESKMFQFTSVSARGRVCSISYETLRYVPVAMLHDAFICTPKMESFVLRKLRMSASQSASQSVSQPVSQSVLRFRDIGNTGLISPKFMNIKPLQITAIYDFSFVNFWGVNVQCRILQNLNQFYQ